MARALRAPGPAEVTVVVRAHWSAAWLLRRAARPWLDVDGREREVAWGQEVVLRLSAGVHRVEAFARYSPWLRVPDQRPAEPERGGRLLVQVAAGDRVRVVFRNTWVTSAPFTAALSGPSGAWRFDADRRAWVAPDTAPG